MNSRLFVVSLLSLILLSCGIQKQVSSTNASDSSKVQNTFFGASFGDSDETKVLEVMKTNGIGSMWWSGQNGEYVFRHVYFAGQTWDMSRVSFADKQFCGIIFCKRFDTKEEAIEMLGKMNELLDKKYSLKKETLDGKYDDTYMYTDAEGDYVFSSILFAEKVESGQWTYSLGYRWHLAASIKEQAVLNEL